MTTALFEVLIDPTGDSAEADDPAAAVLAAQVLLAEARDGGAASPSATFYADGRLVRAGVRRTDVAQWREPQIGVCWCGRFGLYAKARLPFCCAKHEVLWNEWDVGLRARTVVARFVHIYGRKS